VTADPEELAPADLAGGSGPHLSPLCPECRSPDVRPSRSSYPLDREKNADGAAGFWRCENCGGRHLGPPAPRRSSRLHDDPLRRQIAAERGRKRWLPALLIVVTTIMGTILILVLRDRAS
jgi:hypothetical protein